MTKTYIYSDDDDLGQSYCWHQLNNKPAFGNGKYCTSCGGLKQTDEELFLDKTEIKAADGL